LSVIKGYRMSEDKKKRGRPPLGEQTGTRINLYLTEPREQLFERAYELLREKGMLPSTSSVNNSRTDIVDFALDALIEKLEKA
jgi:hypothetical protein